MVRLHRRRMMSRAGRSAVCVVAAGLMVACSSSGSANASHDRPSSTRVAAPPTTTAPNPVPAPVPLAGPIRTAMLTTTPGLGEGFEYTIRGDRLTVSAPTTNTSGNLRAVFFGADTPESRDQQVCMDWPTPDGRAQPGIALRIRPPTAEEPVRAIVLDQNIWDDVLWSIHVLLFDGTTTGELSNMTALTTFPMLDTFYDTDSVAANVVPERRPGPWHVCARVVGSTLRFKAWVHDAPEPSWSDATHARSVELPAEWVYAGHPGGYVAHVHPGRSLDFDNVVSRELPPGS